MIRPFSDLGSFRLTRPPRAKLHSKCLYQSPSVSKTCHQMAFWRVFLAKISWISYSAPKLDAWASLVDSATAPGLLHGEGLGLRKVRLRNGPTKSMSEITSYTETFALELWKNRHPVTRWAARAADFFQNSPPNLPGWSPNPPSRPV